MHEKIKAALLDSYAPKNFGLVENIDLDALDTLAAQLHTEGYAGNPGAVIDGFESPYNVLLLVHVLQADRAGATDTNAIRHHALASHPGHYRNTRPASLNHHFGVARDHLAKLGLVSAPRR